MEKQNSQMSAEVAVKTEVPEDVLLYKTALSTTTAEPNDGPSVNKTNTAVSMEPFQPRESQASLPAQQAADKERTMQLDDPAVSPELKVEFDVAEDASLYWGALHNTAVMPTRLAEEAAEEEDRQKLPSTSPTKPRKRRKRGAEVNRAYKERMAANDPLKFEAYMQRRRMQCKTWRQNLSEEQRARISFKSKLRMRAKRQREMEASSQAAAKPVVVLRATQEEKREKWRERKRHQRANMSCHEKQRVNEKRREDYRELRLKQNKEEDQCPENKTPSTPPGHQQPDLALLPLQGPRSPANSAPSCSVFP